MLAYNDYIRQVPTLFNKYSDILNIDWVSMSQESFFERYIEILVDGFKKINKIGFKKLPAPKSLFETFQGYLNKQVYGRIQPSNYLLLFLVLLGCKNSKLYPIIIQTVQKLFSNNYIAIAEDISPSLRFIKEDLKEYLLLPIQDYSKKYFHELYIESLINLSDKDQALNLMICKNLSLIFRLSQNSISHSLLISINQFIIEVILQNKSEETDKTLKSVHLEIVRHAVESLKENQDKRMVDDDEFISIKENCKRYNRILADKATLSIKAEEVYGIKNYDPIPKDSSNFRYLPLEEVNENNEKNGKFGWCIICRQKANYYCKNYRVPVCGYRCKQKNLTQTQQSDKIQSQQKKSQVIFERHINTLCKIISKYLSHPDIRKRAGFAQIFVHLSSQLKKIPQKSITAQIKESLKEVFKECTMNIILETEAFSGCIIAIRKLLSLNIFISEVEILYNHLTKKLLHFMTQPNIKEEIIRFCKQNIRGENIFEYFIALDCDENKSDAVKDLIDAISKIYTGIKPPSGLIIPPEDNSVRKSALQTLILFEKSIRTSTKEMNQEERIKITRIKRQKNRLKNAINSFNIAEKPVKAVNKLIKQGFLTHNPVQVSNFLHQNLKKLSPTNVGVLIGDQDPFAQQIRDNFIGSMKFKDELVDEGVRILLSHFTIPGESQVVERIIDSFSREFYEQNRDTNIFAEYGAVFSFSYLLMMLQTNLHNPQVVEKMTLQQFSNLSKNMNGPGSEFPPDFLQEIYQSIQRRQLGFHEKHAEMELNNAYQQNLTKKAQQIYYKDLQKQGKQSFQKLNQDDQVVKVQRYHLELMTEECYESLIEVISLKIHELQEKEEILKYIDIIESMIKFSLGYQIEDFVGLSIKKLWEQITKIISLKKYILIEKLLTWVREFHLYIYDQWNVVIYLFSMFYRNKLMKKQAKDLKQSTNKSAIIVMINEKCFIYEHYVEFIFSKTSYFNVKNLQKIVSALIEISREEIKENHHPFCLDKVNDILDNNSSRMPTILPILWPVLSKYYVELGQNKIEKVAIFGTDFLKQQITKFFKKKDLFPFQKEYLQPLQQIFSSSVALVVKEYIIGSISYFVNNHNINIKLGWKVILPVLSAAFEEDEDPSVKEKAHSIVKQLYDSQFRIIDLEENYSDFVQILGRMAHQKQQVYQRSCLVAANMITSYYHKKLQMDLDSPSENKIDINFWQTRWLPLLSTIYGICGDFRPQLQKQAIECLFGILTKYGQLFDYEFWKMILQGVLRPTFEEITYTSQSKPLQKKKLEEWLKNSFSLLFQSISELIQRYFKDFQLFLSDIFKIYESCILSNSNKILVQLSMQALTDLLKSVGENFEDLNWTQYIQFVENICRKSYLSELDSVESWKKAKQLPDNTYENKYLAINLLLENIQTVLENFSSKLNIQHIKDLEAFVSKIYIFSREFNSDIGLRDVLWKNGFFSQMKSLPGLNKQEYESLKTLTITKFKMVEKSEENTAQYIDHVLQIFKKYISSLIFRAPQSPSLDLEEKERQVRYLQVLILEIVVDEINQIGLKKIVELGYKKVLFENLLQLSNRKTYCAKCKFCETCNGSGEREKKFSESIRKLLMELFNLQL